MSAAIHRSHAVFHLLPGVMMNRDGFGAAESFSEELDLLDSELLDLLDGNSDQPPLFLRGAGDSALRMTAADAVAAASSWGGGSVSLPPQLFCRRSPRSDASCCERRRGSFGAPDDASGSVSRFAIAELAMSHATEVRPRGGAEAESRLDAPDDLRASAAAKTDARSPSSIAQLRNYPRPERSSDELSATTPPNEDCCAEGRELRELRLARKSMLRLAVRAASGAVAGAAMLNLSRATCEPSPSERARQTLDAELRRRGATDAARNLQFSLKGGRLSVRAELPPEADILSALLPLFRHYPRVTYNADAARGAVGWSLLLQPPPSASAAPSVSFFLPRAADGRAAATELEFVAATETLGDADAAALADALAAARQTRARSPDDLFARLEERFARGAISAGHDRATQAGGGAGGTPTERLEAMGVRVYGAGGRGATDGDDGGWSTLAGCDGVRAQLEESLVLPLQNPEVYREVMEGTRAKRRAPHAKAILLAGPPGTGKTSAARVLSAELGRPLVYLPLESVVSKWYGEAEQRLAAVFDAVAELGEAVIFLDEVDALATSRDGGTIHEATRRSLSVLLRKLDGFEANASTVLLAATNRPQDLDAALISRFEQTVHFPLPPPPAREAIFALYARHLARDDVAALAADAGGASGRDIRDVCEAAERRWAAKRVRGEAGTKLPPAAEYRSCLHERAAAAAAASPRGGGGGASIMTA